MIKKTVMAAAVPLAFAGRPVSSVWTTPQTEVDVADDSSSETVSDEEPEAIVNEYLETMEQGEESQYPMISETIPLSGLPMEGNGKGKLRYTLLSWETFIASVPNGMITEKAVRFEFPDGFIGMVQEDDGEPSTIKDSLFTEPGAYQLKLLFFQPPSPEILDNNVYEVHYSFTVIGEKDRQLGVVTASEQFQISEAIKNGIPQSEVNPQFCFLMEDGVYEIRYQDKNTSTIHLKANFVRDTMAPPLNSSKDITQRDVTGPVEFTASEPNSTVTITHNGSRGQLETNTLTADGFYVLEVRGSTGNSRCYQLILRQTYKLLDTRLIILALIFLVGLIGRLLYLRRNMRVI